MLVEPVLNTIWAAIFHAEVPGAWSVAGALVILGATCVHSLHAARRGRRGIPPTRGHS